MKSLIFRKVILPAITTWIVMMTIMIVSFVYFSWWGALIALLLLSLAMKVIASYLGIDLSSSYPD